MCVATQANPIARVSEKLLNDTFSSLSLASPSASTFSVDVISLASQATATKSSSTESESESAPPTETPSDVTKSSDTVSSGAIAGAAVGGVAAVAAVAALIWILLRRRRTRKRQSTPHDPNISKDEHSDAGGQVYAKFDATQYRTAEVEGSHGWNEMTGEGNGLLSGVKEMPDTSMKAEAKELPG